MKIDYAFKSQVMKEHSDLLKLQRKVSKYEYAIHLYNTEGIVSYSLKKGVKSGLLRQNELHSICLEKGSLNVLKECYKINDAFYHRVKRLKERINNLLLNGSCLFLTLTFTDEVLSSTSEETRRRYVQRFLKLYDGGYIANIDYGVDDRYTKREHYHAIINTEKVYQKDWPYGNLDFERVRYDESKSDRVKMAKYISKLSNHAIKDSTKRSALIYSR